MPDATRRTLFGTAAAATLATAAQGAAPETTTMRPIPPLDPANRFATAGAAPAQTLPVHTSRALTVQALTPEAFAPFGQVLTAEGRRRLPINTYGDRLDLFREGFESDQPTEWFIFLGRDRGAGVLFLERHQQLTQTFIPVGGKGFHTVVARPGAREEGGLPALDELAAFWVPGDAAIQLHRATWHENPMPVEDGTRMLVTSHANLTLAHQADPDPRLRALPLDLERRWYRHAGYDLSVTRFGSPMP
ncbi:ureidoglycolate lyase [Roseomonas sp. CCTCC AB2023176]|uniref:ureidoglycolate lyase n=1 Tax=Roseomonas sp. CCTCC AB2023176 TaxID=3342640 RepID=UPI0035D6F79F